MRSKLPVIDALDDISREDIDTLMKIGFSYVKLPETIIGDLKELTEKGINFFRLNESKKQQFPVNNRFEGYINHQKDNAPQSAQRFIFRPEKPVGPFSDDKDLIARISSVFQSQIGFTLVKQVFQRANLAKHFKETIKDSFSTFSLIYYPKQLEKVCDRGINGHKDWDLITVLLITKPGLEVLINGRWEPIPPKPGYVIVNLANALELMLGKRCTSAMHRVQLPKEERISIGIFIGPNKHAPVKDYTTDTIKYNSYNEYLNGQMKILYKEPTDQSIIDSYIDKFELAFKYNLEKNWRNNKPLYYGLLSLTLLLPLTVYGTMSNDITTTILVSKYTTFIFISAFVMFAGPPTNKNDMLLNYLQNTDGCRYESSTPQACAFQLGKDSQKSITSYLSSFFSPACYLHSTQWRAGKAVSYVEAYEAAQQGMNNG